MVWVLNDLRRFIFAVHVLHRGLPVDDEAAALRRRDDSWEVDADEFDDPVLEPGVHDGLFPSLYGQVVGQDVGFAEVDDLDSLKKIVHLVEEKKTEKKFEKFKNSSEQKNEKMQHKKNGDS